MFALAFVALGGAIGACMRFGISELMAWLLGRGFPYGTMTVNILGSLIMGLMVSLIQHQWLSGIPWRPFIMVGLLGALTTFSSFALDNILLLEQGAFIKAALNVVINVVVCLAAVYVGMQLIPSRS
ncbi:fluoride efflux transporter CrcB [Dongshaea marina]|uniref:fluoride efflux transporter CrcB n=1 Tax=Dongshaea marina TaxID=2047966 RepID=UPI000D3ED236|nr:fluoride efflux transporter CrcB [Dongshaea marina]